MLADVFESFRDKCIEIYNLDPVNFLSAPGLAWQACLKQTKVELELLTDNDILIMLEEGTRGRICQATYRYAKANNKYMKNYYINIKSSFLKYLDANEKNVKDHRDTKLVTTNKQRSVFTSEPNYHSTKYISKDLLIMKMKK